VNAPPVAVAIAALREGWAIDLAAGALAMTVGVANVRSHYRHDGRLLVVRMPHSVEQDEWSVEPVEDWRTVTYTRDGTAEAVIDAIGAAVVLIGDGTTDEMGASPSASH
jgi:hypothetical protein